MLFKHIINTIFEDLSGIRARENVFHLTHYNRIQASPGFREAAEYVRGVLEEYGFDNAKILEFPADGKINQWDWESPIAWKGIDAELWLIEPHKELLCDYHEVPTCLISHSQSAVTVADLVDVGPGTDEWHYNQSFVQDSIVLTTGPARDVYPFLIKNGVQGMIRYPSDIRSFQYPDMVIADAFWPVNEDRDIIPFGFSISRRQAERLKGYLAEGKKVRVMAKVNADLGDGDLNIVEASLPADEEDAEEILMVAHLCNPKPSANDNASGSGLMLEIARVLRKLILEGKLAPNKRTIRFLWLTEYSGAIAWLHWNFHKIDNIFACINLNAVGESPERIGTPLRVSIPPYSTESFLEDLMSAIAELVAEDPRYCSMDGSRRKLKYELEAFSGTSDHTIFIDKYFDIPSIMLGHEDQFSGTNMDIIENVDSSELLRVGLIATTAAYSLVAPDNSLARQMLLFQKAGSHSRVNHFFKRALLNIYESQAADLDIHFYNEVGKASFLIKREEENLDSLTRYYDNDDFHDRIEEVITNFKAFSIKELKAMEKALRERGAEVEYQITRLKTLPQEYREAQALVPIQKVNAPFRGIFKKVVFQRLHKSTKDWLKNNSLAKKGNVYGEIHNLLNGTNSIFDIYIAVDLQFGNIKLSDVRTYIVLLQKVQLVDIKMLKKKKLKEEKPEAAAETTAVPEPEEQKEKTQEAEALPEAGEKRPEEVYDEAEVAALPSDVSAEISLVPVQSSLAQQARDGGDSIPSEYLEAMIAEQTDHPVPQPETGAGTPGSSQEAPISGLVIADSRPDSTQASIAESLEEDMELLAILDKGMKAGEKAEVAEEEATEAVAEEATEEATKTAQEATAEVAQEEAQEIAQEEAQEIAQEEAQETAQEEATEAAQEEATEAAQEEATEAAQEETTEAAQEEATEATTEAAQEEATEAAQEETTEAAQEEATEEAQEETTEAAQEEATEEAQEEVTEAAQEETTEAAQEETAETTREEAQEEVTEAAQEETTEAAQEETQETAREEATEAAQEETTEEAQEEATEAAQEEATEEAQEETTKAAQEEATEAAQEEATEAAQEETTEAAQEETQETAREEATEEAQEEATEAAQEETTETAAEETAEVAQEEAQEASTEEAQEASTEEAQEASTEEAQEASTEEAQEASTEEAQEASTEEAQEASTEEAQETAQEEAQEAAQEEATETAQKETTEAAQEEATEAAQEEAPRNRVIIEKTDNMSEEELVEYAKMLEMAEQKEEEELRSVYFAEPTTGETQGAMASQPFESLAAESKGAISADLADYGREDEKAVVINAHAEQMDSDDLDLDSLELDLKKIVIRDASDGGRTDRQNITELEDMNIYLDDFTSVNGAALSSLNTSAPMMGDDLDLESSATDTKRQKTDDDSGNN
ncbi:MAG: DUF4910 domain-containing protein [Vulcanimicrobiota bacterium]